MSSPFDYASRSPCSAIPVEDKLGWGRPIIVTIMRGEAEREPRAGENGEGERPPSPDI